MVFSNGKQSKNSRNTPAVPASSKTPHSTIREHPLLSLQRKIGNAAVGQILKQANVIQRSKQTKITDYFPYINNNNEEDSSHEDSTQEDGKQEEDLPNIRYGPDQLVVEESGGDFYGYLEGEQVSSLELYEDGDGRFWINNVKTNSKYQGQGIGTEMVRQAVLHYGAIFASKGSKYDHENDDSDTRYLTQEGATLVNSCIRKEVMKEEWFFNPAFENEDDIDEDDNFDY